MNRSQSGLSNLSNEFKGTVTINSDSEAQTPKQSDKSERSERSDINETEKTKFTQCTQINNEDITIPIHDIAEFKKYYKNIKSAYNGDVSYESITLDLIAIYLKGQKLLYVESKTFCEKVLYCLMLPAIFISAVCTVISVSLKSYQWGSILVASLTGFNSFILSVVTYLKLDAKSEAHRTASYQFDKLQTMCEFKSGQKLLIPNYKPHIIQNDENHIEQSLKEEDTIDEFVKKIENKVVEIKDVNQFVIPEIIRFRYATIYGTNIFAIVKKYKTDRMLQAQRLLVINEILKTQKWYTGPPKIPIPESMDRRTVFKVIKNMFTDEEEKISVFTDNELDIYTATEHELRREKDRLINLIIEYRKISSRINNAFNIEINGHIKRRKNRWFNCCSWLKT